MTTADFIRRHDLEATLVNGFGEGAYLGPAVNVIPVKYGWSAEWSLDKDIQHISPFDRLILHGGTDIFHVMNIKPVILTGSNRIQVMLQ